MLRPILFQNKRKCEKSIRKFYESFLVIFCVFTILNSGFLLNSVDALEHHTGKCNLLNINLHIQLNVECRRFTVDTGMAISSQKFLHLFISTFNSPLLFFLCICCSQYFFFLLHTPLIRKHIIYVYISHVCTYTTNYWAYRKWESCVT